MKGRSRVQVLGLGRAAEDLHASPVVAPDGCGSSRLLVAPPFRWSRLAARSRKVICFEPFRSRKRVGKRALQLLEPPTFSKSDERRGAGNSNVCELANPIEVDPRREPRADPHELRNGMEKGRAVGTHR